jgi:hypothetical protein
MNKKIKEIIEALEFMGKVGEVSKIAVDNLKTGLEELDEQLTLTDVGCSVLTEDNLKAYNKGLIDGVKLNEPH